MNLRNAQLVDATADLLAEALAPEPLAAWLVPARDRRSVVMRDLLTLVLAEAAVAGTVDVRCDPRGVPQAAAVWFDRTDPGILAGADAEPDPRLEAVFGADVARWRVLDGLLAGSHPVTPHHHLMLLGVRPDLQGHGLGESLLRTRHAHLDRDGVPAYVAAVGGRSHDLFASLGYLPLGEALVLSTGPVIRPMWRPVGGG